MKGGVGSQAGREGTAHTLRDVERLVESRDPFIAMIVRQNRFDETFFIGLMIG